MLEDPAIAKPAREVIQGLIPRISARWEADQAVTVLDAALSAFVCLPWGRFRRTTAARGRLFRLYWLREGASTLTEPQKSSGLVLESPSSNCKTWADSRPLLHSSPRVSDLQQLTSTLAQKKPYTHASIPKLISFGKSRQDNLRNGHYQ